MVLSPLQDYFYGFGTIDIYSLVCEPPFKQITAEIYLRRPGDLPILRIKLEDP